MPKRIAKPKLQNHTKTSIRMILPLMALTIATGFVLVVSSFASGVYPSSYVNNLYSQAYHRAVDKAGLTYWQNQFQTKGCNATMLATVSKSVFSSNEFAMQLDSNTGIVTRIYNGALQRTPDSTGLAYWAGKLSSGASRASVASSIINASTTRLTQLAGTVCVAPVVTQPPTATKPPTTTKPPATTTNPPATPDTSDKTPPSKPEKFTAKVDQTSSSITLTWDEATDNVGVANYKLERSTDGTSWKVLDDTIVDSIYNDRTVTYNTTYKYRLTALDGAGNAGTPATAEAKTGEFKANANATDSTAIASDDNVVIASLPAGAIPKDSSCSITTDTDNLTELTGVIGKATRLSGPYLVSCKDSNGDVVAGFDKTVTVTMAPPSKATRGNTNFKVYVYDLQAQQWSLIKSTYNKKDKTYTVSIEGPSQVVFVGEKAPNYWPLFFSIFIPALLVGGGAFWYYNRKMQKQQYADYIKKKYYNL